MNKNTINGYIYYDKNKKLMVIKSYGILYLEYLNDSYSNVLPLPESFKNIIVFLKQEIDFQIDKFSLMFNIKNSRIKLKKTRPRLPNLNIIKIKFENEENYNFHSLDLTSKIFNQFLKKNKINTKVKLIKKGKENFILLRTIIDIDKVIKKNPLQILKILTLNYANFLKEIENIEKKYIKKNLISKIKVLKIINVKLALYNFLISKIFSLLNQSNEKQQNLVYKIIKLNDYINLKIGKIEEKLSLSSTISINKLKILAKNTILKNNKIINIPKKIIDFPQFKIPKIKIIKCFSIIHTHNTEGSCFIVKNEHDILKLNKNSIAILDNPYFIMKVYNKVKTIIIEKGWTKTVNPKILEKKGFNLIELHKAMQLLNNNSYIRVKKNIIEIIK